MERIWKIRKTTSRTYESIFCNNRIEAKKDEEEILSALEDTNNAYLLQSE